MARPSSPIQLLKPSTDGADLRANVCIKAGPLADQIRELAEGAQMDNATAIRLLCVEALQARQKRAG